MTQEWLDKVEEVKGKINPLLEELRSLREQCDHRTPDGKSAYDHGLSGAYCKLCGDFGPR